MCTPAETSPQHPIAAAGSLAEGASLLSMACCQSWPRMFAQVAAQPE